MSTNTERAPVEMPTERTVPGADLVIQREHGSPQDSRSMWRLFIAGIGVGAALLVTVVIYVFFLVQPFEPTSRNLFLIFARGNTTIWPMQLVCYASALTMVGLALWQGRRASQLICLLAAAVFTWVGIVYFGVFDNGMHFAWVWVAVFLLEAILFLVAGIVRRDLVFAPRWDLSGVLGAVVIGVGLVGFPLVEALSGYPLHSLTVFGLSPPGAGRVCLCLPRGGALSAAQMGRRGAHHYPVVLPDQQCDPQDTVGQPSGVRDIAGLAGKHLDEATALWFRLLTPRFC